MPRSAERTSTLINGDAKRLKRVLFVTAKVLPNSSQAVRYRHLIEHFAKDFDVTILSLHDYLGKESALAAKVLLSSSLNGKLAIAGEGMLSSRSHRRPLRDLIHRVFKSYCEPLLFPDRFVFAIPRYKRTLKRLFAENAFDTVIIGMTPYSLYLLTPFLKKRLKCGNLVIDLSDPFICNGGSRHPKIYKKLFVKSYERHFLRFGDAAVVLNPSVKKLYESVYAGSLPSKGIHVVEQGFELSNVARSRESLGQSSQLTLVYGGGLYRRFRDPFELYKAIGEFSGDIRLRLFGSIRQDLLPDPGDTRFYYGGSISQSMLTHEYLQADLVVMIDNLTGYQVPGKTLELIVLRKPVLFIYSSDDSPTLYYAKGYNGFIRVRNKASDIGKALQEFSRLRKGLDFQYDIERFSWQNLAHVYRKLF